MGREQARQYKDSARSLEEAQHWEDAAETYSRMAFAYLGESVYRRPYSHVTWGLFGLLKGATNYRLAGLPSRSRNRCDIGILVAEDVRSRVSDEPIPENFYDHARRGVWDEFIGDFRVIGRYDNSCEAYDAAQEIYRDAGDPSTEFAEQEHLRLLEYFRSVAKQAEYSTEILDELNSGMVLSNWVDLKRIHLPEILDELS